MAENISKADSEIVNHQKNDFNKLRLPASTQYHTSAQSIKSSSLLIHLSNQDDTDPSNQSISTNSPESKTEDPSSPKLPASNSEDQNLATTVTETDDSELSNAELDDKVSDEIHTPIMLTRNSNIIQRHPTKIFQSPLRTAVIISPVLKLFS